jgi:hypothetical protein
VSAIQSAAHRILQRVTLMSTQKGVQSTSNLTTHSWRTYNKVIDTIAIHIVNKFSCQTKASCR